MSTMPRTVILQSPSTRLVIRLIRFYQCRISPIKGFRCAHHALYGGDSCSEAILKIVQTRGLWNSLAAVRRRFRECALAARAYRLRYATAAVAEAPTDGDIPPDRNKVPTAVHLACGSGAECCGMVGLEGCCSLLT